MIDLIGRLISIANAVGENSIHHEHVYPLSDGEGTAGDPVSVSNSTTDDAGGARDDQNYWGDVVRIIPPGALADEWRSIGIYIHASTAADIQQWEIFFLTATYAAAQNGGNDWDKDETLLTVADGSMFEADDLVWVTGTDRLNGEILVVVSEAADVVTVISETRMGGDTGLRYDYDGAPGANMLYVAHRLGATAPTILHGFEGEYSAANAKDSARYTWHASKAVPASGGLLMRMLNATDDGASSFDVQAIYEN